MPRSQEWIEGHRCCSTGTPGMCRTQADALLSDLPTAVDSPDWCWGACCDLGHPGLHPEPGISRGLQCWPGLCGLWSGGSDALKLSEGRARKTLHHQYSFWAREDFTHPFDRHRDVSWGWLSLCVPSHFSRVRLCDSVDHSPPGPSVHGILLAGILEWAAMLSSRGSSWPREETRVSQIGRRILYHLSHQGNPEKLCVGVAIDHKEKNAI